jgi:hypothetical protein
MRVLKNTVCGISAQVSSMLFNTLQSFVSQKRLHPVGRPFAHVLSAGQDLVSYTHYANAKRKTLEFLVPGSFEFCDLTELTITPLKRSRNAWNTIHATIRM